LVCGRDTKNLESKALWELVGQGRSPDSEEIIKGDIFKLGRIKYKVLDVCSKY